MTPQTIVIGSGISGLTTASLLARQGHKVLVLEKNREPGGVLQRFKRKSIDFDVGFHYSGGLGNNEILSTLWDYLGILKDIKILPFPANAADHVRITDSDFHARAYFSYKNIQEELSQLFPKETKCIKNFFSIIKNRGESIPFYNMTGELKPFLQSLAFPEKQSLGDILRNTVKDQKLQSILSLPVFLHGVPPDIIGTTMHASVAHSVYNGMYSIDGGGRTIIKAYTNLLSKQDVEIKSCSEVEQIFVKNGQVAGVATTEENYEATNVVYTGHPSDIYSLVPEKTFKKAYVSRLSQLKNTCSMLLVFGTIKNNLATQETTWNNFYQLPQGLEFFNNIDYNNNSCFFLSGCGLRDSDNSNHSDKLSAVTLMRPANWNEVSCFDNGKNKRRAAGYQQWKQQQTTKLIETAHKTYPEMMSNFQPVTTSSPLTFRDELNYPHGTIYGMQHSLEQFSIGTRTHLPGLWLSGQNTLMPGVLGASLSALITVGSMTDLETLWKEVIQ